MSLPFPLVMQKASEFEKEYRASKEKIAKMSSGATDSASSQDRVVDQTKELSSVVSSLPEFQKKKLLIDTHINTATAMLSQINQRKLDLYIQIEETITSRISSVDPETLLALIRDHEKGTPTDKLRLFLIYFYETDSIPKDVMEAFETALLAAGVPENLAGIINHIRSVKTFSKKRTPMLPLPKPSPNVATPGSLLARGYDQLAGMLSAGVQLINSGGNKDFQVTRIVDAVLNSAEIDPSFGSFVTIDPKAPTSHPVILQPGQFRTVIVFIVGGGSYSEYQNLQSLAQRQPNPTTIIYGSSDIYSPTAFIDQISRIAQPFPTAGPSSSSR